ncbi:MAG: hypothetical protein KA419_10320 [Acidobacteria bacterium]|nr:hypothetical protein [Acidobacteriota bacterium]
MKRWVRGVVLPAVMVLALAAAVSFLRADDPKPGSDPGRGSDPAAVSSPASPSGTDPGAATPPASGKGKPASKPKEPPRRGGRPALIVDDQTEQETPVAAEAPPDPKKAKDHFRIGQFYSRRGNWDAAASRFKEAVRNKPDWPEARRRHVEALSRAGDWAAAEDAARAYLKDAANADDRKYFQGAADQASVERAKMPADAQTKPREPVKPPPTLW